MTMPGEHPNKAPEDTGRLSINELMLLMVDQMRVTAQMVLPDEAESFFSELLNAGKIYVAGAGRSGLVARAFAMRLMHIGFESYVIGETITPALSPGDTLVVFSGSGETNSVFDVLETARELGGRICLITATPVSRMSRLAHSSVILCGSQPSDDSLPTQYEVRQITGQYRSVSSSFAPFGTLFETAALIFSDAIISALIEAKHCSLDEARTRLSNVQ
ncbi:MAG TPA: SIS domain-containing protein [Methanoregulaceae archaeon]|nr:SIS domain-containing protein [Methanoregulaceae archaeon]